MKIFEQPEVNVIKFAVEDVITTSGGDATEATPIPTTAGPSFMGANCITTG